ncbi:MAG: type II toxin-antitoxin system Phd/YefM family antitoxin [Verrucomicrobiota bacterium]
MKTATVRDLRNHYTRILGWIAAGEEVLITRRGKSVARLCPETHANGPETVDWSRSVAVTRDRSGERVLTAAESARLVAEAGGRW